MPQMYNKKQNVFLMFRRGATSGLLQATCVWNKRNWRPQIGKDFNLVLIYISWARVVILLDFIKITQGYSTGQRIIDFVILLFIGIEMFCNGKWLTTLSLRIRFPVQLMTHCGRCSERQQGCVECWQPNRNSGSSWCPPPGAAGRSLAGVRARRRQERQSSECDEAGRGLGRSSREAGSETSDIRAAEQRSSPLRKGKTRLW